MRLQVRVAVRGFFVLVECNGGISSGRSVGTAGNAPRAIGQMLPNQLIRSTSYAQAASSSGLLLG